MKLPIAKVVLPKDLKSQANGQLHPVLLIPVPGGRLHHLAANAWRALCAAATVDGIKLAPTSDADTYRNLHVQELTFFKRYDNTPRKTRKEKYQGKTWWLKPGVAGAAVPGTSNHGWGLAVDVADMGQHKLEWLLQHATAYGFSWEDASENWHIRYVAGDKVPAAVLAYLRQQ